MFQKYSLFLVLFSLIIVSAQDKFKADSLKQLLLRQKLTVSEQIDVYSQLAQLEQDPTESLQYSDKLILLAKEHGSTENVLQGLLQKGNSLKALGRISEALKVYLEAFDMAESTNDIYFSGNISTAIAGAYSVMDNKTSAISFYKKALSTFENTQYKRDYGIALANLGDEYLLALKPDSALYFFERSGKIFKEEKYDLGLAYITGYMGLSNAQLGNSKLAEANLLEAIKLLDSFGAYDAICAFKLDMSDVYLDKKEIEVATDYAQNSLDLALKYSLRDEVSDAYLKLSEIAENDKNLDAALDLYKTHIVYRDSVKNLAVAQEIAEQRRVFEVNKQKRDNELMESEAEKSKAITLGTGIALLLSALLAVGLYRRTLFISKTKKIIQAEQYRSDKLLLNILPGKIANELKSSGRVKAKKYESVSVLFSDFKGFTNYAENLSPELLVETIGYYFSEFDRVIEKHGLEKIKTMGDSYMCASGLPFPSDDHALKVAKAALEMLQFVKKVKDDASKEHANFDIRIGINSGPVVAGVVGNKKFAYDIWGDTVNVASRMESMSEGGKINVSQSTYLIIKEDFHFTDRGKFEVKNHGAIKMYFLEESDANTT